MFDIFTISVRRMAPSDDRQILTFIEDIQYASVIEDSEMFDSIQTVLVDLSGYRLSIHIPTITEHMLQNGVYQTIQIGENVLTINLHKAINHLLSGEYSIQQIDKHTLQVDAKELATKMGLTQSAFYQRKATEHGWTENDMADLEWVLENLFPDIIDIKEAIGECLSVRSDDEIGTFSQRSVNCSAKTKRMKLVICYVSLKIQISYSCITNH